MHFAPSLTGKQKSQEREDKKEKKFLTPPMYITMPYKPACLMPITYLIKGLFASLV